MSYELGRGIVGGVIGGVEKVKGELERVRVGSRGVVWGRECGEGRGERWEDYGGVVCDDKGGGMGN